MSSDIRALTDKIIAFRDERDWKQFHNAKDTSLSLLLEASELLELFQWKQGAEIEETVSQKKEDIANELADVLYWTLLMARDLDIDIAKALELKLAANERKYPRDKARGTSKKYTEL